MDEEFESFVVTNPELVDPGIDVSGLRTTTDANILGNISDFPGIQYEAYNPTRLSDLMNLYSRGLPTLATDTAQIPGAVDTLVDTSDMDQATGGSMLDTPTNTQFEQNLIDQGIGVQDVIGDPVVAPGEMPVTQEEMDAFNEIAVTPVTPVDTSIAIEDLTQPGSIEDFQVTAAPPLTNQTQITDPVTPIQDLPMVTTSIDAQGNIFDAQTEQYLGNKFDEVALTGTGTPEQQEGFLQNVLGRAGQTVDNALTELGKVPGAVVDFANQTVDVFGQKLNVGKTLASVAINQLVNAPVSLVFDLLPPESLANQTSKSIVDELKGQTNKSWNKFNMTVGNLNVDPFGRSPTAAFGSYEQSLKEDVLGINQTGFQTAEMREAKKDFAEAYFDAKAEKAGGVVTEPGTVVGPGEMPVTQEEIDAFNAPPPGINIVDEVALTGGDNTPSGPPEGPGITPDDAFADDGPSNAGGPPSGPGATADDGFSEGDGPSNAGGPPSGPGATADEGFETNNSSGGGSGGGGGCVIATHAVNSGAFTKDTKREAVRWCVKNLHRTWWGEAVRKGYRYYGQKAIEQGNAKNHYQEFKDYVAFGTGKRRTLKTGWTFVYRTVQFFLKGLTL